LGETEEGIKLICFQTLNSFIHACVYGDLNKELDDMQADNLSLVRVNSNMETSFITMMIESSVKRLGKEKVKNIQLEAVKLLIHLTKSKLSEVV
jgi:hypothetical protein